MAQGTEQAPPRSPKLTVAVVGPLTVVAVALAVQTGLTAVSGGSKLTLILPLAVPAAIGLGLLALTRFERFVLVLLAIRASLDSARVGSAPTRVVTEAAPPPSHGLDPAAVVAVGFILASLLWLAWRRNQAGPSRAPLLERALCLFLGLWAVSIVGSARPMTSLLEAVRIGAVVLMLMVLDRLLTDRRRVHAVLVAAFASASGPLLVAAYQTVSSHGRFEAGGFSRIRGTFVHPSPFALYLTFIIVMGAALVPHVQGRLRLGLVVILGGCGTALLLTYTRTGWIGTVAGLVVVGLLQSRKLLAVMFLGGLLLVAVVPSVLGRFSDLSHQQQASGTAGNSLIWRFNYWSEAVPLAKDNPATGLGLKMLQYNTQEQKAPHNDFIRAYVETGILGLAGYIWLLASLVRTAWASVVRTRAGLDRGIAVGFAACVVVYGLVSLVSNVVSQVVLLWYFFTFAASAMAVARFPAEEPEPAQAGVEPATVPDAGGVLVPAGG
jgi:O-antigen ligase